jgi:hypothetical protein
MKKICEDIKKVFESKSLFRILLGLGIIIVMMLTFSAGVTVGFHKASFGRAWGEHYNENFGMGPKNGRMGDLQRVGPMDYFPSAHGATGKIIKMELPNVIVQDKDNIEKVVSTNADTKIQKGRTEIATKDLRVDDFIVVIGTPNDQGIVEAKLIRVIPSPKF